MSEKGKYGNTMRYVGLGSQMMALLLVSLWLGNKLDDVIGWRFPVLLVTLPLLALVVSLWQLIKAFDKPKK